MLTQPIAEVLPQIVLNPGQYNLPIGVDFWGACIKPDVIVLKIPIATIVFSVLLRFTHSDYPFGIFKLFLTDCWKHLQWDLIMFKCIFKRLSTTFEELDVVHFRAGWSLRWVDILSDNVVSLFVDSLKTLDYRQADKTNWINLSHQKMSKNEKC